MPSAIPQCLVRCLRLYPCHRCDPRCGSSCRRDAARDVPWWGRSLRNFRLLGRLLRAGPCAGYRRCAGREYPNTASAVKARPIVWASGQANLWRKAGLINVVEVPIVLSFDYTDFLDYWSSFSTGPTRIAQRLIALPTELRSEIERHVRGGYLAGLPDGPRSFAVIVRAVRGIVPQ